MQCPICKNSETENYLNLKDTYSSDHFDITKCNTCHFEWLSNAPLPSEIGKYYENTMGGTMRTKRSIVFSNLQRIVFNLDLKSLMKNAIKTKSFSIGEPDMAKFHMFSKTRDIMYRH